MAAKYGFRNHWYPALFSTRSPRAKCGRTALGEKIVLHRIDGRVFGIRDRCLHRGVQFSRKPNA